jgi:hypothetical protein
MLKKTLHALAALLVVIQFIRPAKNVSPHVLANDLFQLHPAPFEVRNAIQTACYDCHSNNTRYPWYAEIQPVAWWLADHVNEGKSELNFSEFGHLNPTRASRKLKKSAEELEEGEMPLKSYTLIHRDARLTPDQQKAVLEWLETLALQLKPEAVRQP